MNAVPLPGVLSTVTVPRRARTASRTTSSPTPRPESSLTVSRVEKPGSKIRLTTRGSSAAVPGEIIPSAIPLRTILSRSSPRPSSSTRIATRSPSWPAQRVIRPTRGLALLDPLVRGLERVVDGVADQVDHRVAQPLDDRPVEPRLLADDPQLDLLAGPVGQVADDPGEPREQLVDRDHPQVERRVADLAADALERLERVEPELGALDVAEAHQVVREHGQLAREADQVVELGGVDPDAGVGPRHVPGCRGRRACRRADGLRGGGLGGRRGGRDRERRRGLLDVDPGRCNRRLLEAAAEGGGRRGNSGRCRPGQGVPASVRLHPLDRDGAVVGEEEEDLVDLVGAGVGLERDRPDEVAPLGVDVLEGRDAVDVGLDPGSAEVAELVEARRAG